MNRRGLLFLAAAFVLFAKGRTEAIVISGADLAAPVRIVDAAITDRFQVWSGFIAEWEREAKPPKYARVYDVRFETSRRNPGTYTVKYAVDAAAGRGYVYLPGKGEAAYKDNVWLILRGVEGKWFEATKSWRAVADPLIAATRLAR